MATDRLRDVARSRFLDEVVESYGVKLDGRPGQRVRQGLCVKHNEEDGSFTVYADSQRFYCFGCGWWGDSLDFIKFMENLSLREASAKVQNLPDPSPASQSRRPKRYRPPRRDGVLVEHARQYYANCLFKQASGEPGRRYLQGRNIKQASARFLSIGYCSGDGLANHFNQLGFNVKRQMRSGLFTKYPRERFEGMVVVPEMRRGRPIWMTGRRINDDVKPKYQTIPGAKVLLGLGTIRKESRPDELLITEGVFDYIVLRQWGMDRTVALAGNGKVERILYETKKSGASSVAFALDADSKSDGLLESILTELTIPARVAELPEGKDVADLAMIPDGRERFEIALMEARPGATVLKELVCKREEAEKLDRKEKALAR